MAEHPTYLSLVDSSSDDLRLRFRTLVGRDPTPVELKVFTRWKVALSLGMPVASRRRAGGIITRL
jgi:hypothetical protein